MINELFCAIETDDLVKFERAIALLFPDSIRAKAYRKRLLSLNIERNGTNLIQKIDALNATESRLKMAAKLLALGVTLQEDVLHRTKNLPLISLYVASGIDVDSRYNGKTPLHVAIMVAEYDKALKLLKCGANPNATYKAPKESIIQSCLHLSVAKSGVEELLKDLIDFGADCKYTTSSGQTAQQLASAVPGNLKILNNYVRGQRDVKNFLNAFYLARTNKNSNATLSKLLEDLLPRVTQFLGPDISLIRRKDKPHITC